MTAPTENNDGSVKSVLFESRDSEGRRVVHATRFDAQLHVIHSNPESFTKDPASDEYAQWKDDFDVEKKTDAIALDLDKHPELRRAMETLVPEKVDYAHFWKRYYFMRHVVETEEQKRRELLKGTQMEEEQVAWDDDEEEEEEDNDKAPATPKQSQDAQAPKQASPSKDAPATDLLKPSEGRRSNENSVADSDASYDLVSGQTSRTPGSPTLEKENGKKKHLSATDQSDDEDWE